LLSTLFAPLAYRTAGAHAEEKIPAVITPELVLSKPSSEENPVEAESWMPIQRLRSATPGIPG
jgi:hypothetical protein